MSKLKNEQIGKKIRQIRTEIGFSQEDLGRGVRLTRAQIANIETGRTELSFQDAISICEFLGLEINELNVEGKNELESLLLFREEGHISNEEVLLDWSDSILKELFAQEELCRNERGKKNA